MNNIGPGSPQWSDYILEGICKASQEAVAMHVREGRGDILLSMEEIARRYRATQPAQA
jgi:hypothetical protein